MMLQPLSRLRLFPTFFLLLFVLTAQGCFYNDDDDTPAKASSVGYYTPNGTYSVSDGAGGTIEISDLQGIVTDSRIMLLSEGADPGPGVDGGHRLIYDGTITSISAGSFEADFTIYSQGEQQLTTTASGTIVAGSSISITLAGSGIGIGGEAFNLLYATANSREPAPVVYTWRGAWGGGYDEIGFVISEEGGVTHGKTSDYGLFDRCKINGEVSPIIGSRLYQVNIELTDCNDPNVNGATYRGLTTTRDGSATDDQLLYLISNGDYALGGEFKVD